MSRSWQDSTVFRVRSENVSYGNQLNICRAKADRYGADWRAIVLCANPAQLSIAMDDAQQFLGGRLLKALQLLKLPNGCSVRFKTVQDARSADIALKGFEFTQIVWLKRPTDESIIILARSVLRSRTVPADDWRYEYCSVF